MSFLVTTFGAVFLAFLLAWGAWLAYEKWQWAEIDKLWSPIVLPLGIVTTFFVLLARSREVDVALLQTRSVAASVALAIVLRAPYVWIRRRRDSRALFSPWVLAIVAVMFLLAAGPYLQQRERREISADAPPAKQSTVKAPGISIVPIEAGGVSAQNEADYAARYLRSQLRTKVRVLPALAFGRSDVNRKRRQVRAEALTKRLSRRFDNKSDDGMILGVTPYDLYQESAGDLNFVFGVRRRDPKLGVLSSARLVVSESSEGAGKNVIRHRFEVLLARYVGAVYLDVDEKQAGRTEGSPFGPLLGVDDLDAMDPDLCPHVGAMPPRSRKLLRC